LSPRFSQLVTAGALVSVGCNLGDAVSELKADQGAAAPATPGSAGSKTHDRIQSATAEGQASAAAPTTAAASAVPPSAATGSAQQPDTAKPLADDKTKPAANSAADLVPACAKEVGDERARVLWRDCLQASADRAPESLQGELCIANQSKSCAQRHRGIQGGCLTGEAPGFCQEYLNRLIDVTCDIKTIDWKNHRYPQGFFRVGGQDDDSFWEIQRGGGVSQVHRVSIGRVMHADLDGDGATEALVRADVQPDDPRAAITSSMIAVFEGEADCNIRHLDSISVVHGLTTNMLSAPVFSVDGKKLVGTWDEFDPNKSEDLLKVRTEWTLTANKLKEAKRKTDRVVNGNAGDGVDVTASPDRKAKPEGAKDEPKATGSEENDAKSKKEKRKRKREKDKPE